MTKAIGSDVEHIAVRRHGAPGSRDRIDRVAGGRREHESRGCRLARPVAAPFGAIDSRQNVLFLAVQATYATEQLRKAVEITRGLELTATHQWGKAEYFRFVGPMPRQQALQAVDHVFVAPRAGKDAVHA